MRFILLLILLFLTYSPKAQTFEVIVPSEVGQDAYVVEEDSTGGYLIGGRIAGSNVPYLLKLDLNGNKLWDTIYAGASEGSFTEIEQFNPNNNIVGGKYAGKPLVVSYDSLGNILWDFDLNFTTGGHVSDFEVNSAGKLVVLASYYDNDLNEERDFVISEIDPASGALLSELEYTDTSFVTRVEDLLLTTDGGYLTIGTTDDADNTNHVAKQIKVFKFDSELNEEWLFEGNWFYDIEEDVSQFIYERRGDLAFENQSGNFTIAYTAYGTQAIDGDNHTKLITLSSSGDLMHERFIGTGINPETTNILPFSNDNIIAFQSVDYYWQSDNGGKMSISRIDSLGNLFWASKFRGAGHVKVFGHRGITTSDGGFAMVGTHYIGTDFWDDRRIYIVKTDSLGQLIQANIRGQITRDENENCEADDPDSGQSGWVVTASNPNRFYYDFTDTAGNYEIDADVGNYTVFVHPGNAYWENCELFFPTGELAEYDTVAHDFPVYATVDCPILEVDISTPFLRRCFDSDYFISYNNQGTIPAEDAYLEITFDELLTVNSSTLPWSSQDGQTFTFDLGTIDINEYGYFAVNVTVGCDEDGVDLGQTHCVEAHIYPDSLCLPADSAWDGSDLVVDAECETDSVRFFIRNTGEDMDEPQEYIIIEDHIIFLQEPFNLPAGGELEIPVATDGFAYRLETSQAPGHPIGNNPSINVIGCNTDNIPDFFTDFWNVYPDDDISPFIAVDCQANVGSYDPNDKQAFPQGYGEENYIEANTEIEYMIRFQNTGTDTAFTVRIEDELSGLLDITSVRPGASSHPYEFDLENDRKLVFTFNNIQLPDSTTNEAASQGFVKFKVEQIPNLEIGKRIYNNASIFFDFNAPIVTNSVRHTIGEDFIESIIISTEDIEEESRSVVIAPNPFREQTTFTIETDLTEETTFILYNTKGQELRREVYQDKQFTFFRKGLSTGLYFYRLETNGTLLDAGKMIIK